MNIQYKGAGEDTKYDRFSIIQYGKDEEEDVERFLLLLQRMCSYSAFCEEEMMYIKVEDRDDFNYVKDCFKAFKRTKLFDKTSKYYSYEAMYETAESDMEMYCFLVNEGRSEFEIKKIMRDVSGADDAYNNALNELSYNLFSI